MNNRIKSFYDLKKSLKLFKKPLVLFSGGLDGCYLIQWLLKHNISSIVCLTLELGGDGDSRSASITAEKLGAKSLVIDKKYEFAKDFVIPAIAAQAKYLNQHPISASLSRPLLAKTAIEVAHQENCDMIIHTATASQNSMRRFNGALSALSYSGIYGSPFELTPVSRGEKKTALLDFGINEIAERNYSSDSNFWCREFEAGSMDDIENFSWPEALFLWSKSKTMHSPSETIKISFENGIPVAFNDETVNFIELVARLNEIVGKFELGRYIGLEELAGGVKFPEVREMPAAHLLLDAYRHLESACLDANSIREKLIMEQCWVREAVEGRWFFELRKAADQFIKSMALNVSGNIEYLLSFRKMQLMSIKAKKPKYHHDRDKYEKEQLEIYSQVNEKITMSNNDLEIV